MGAYYTPSDGPDEHPRTRAHQKQVPRRIPAGLQHAIHKAKRNKTAGPDEIEVEVLKALDAESLKILEHLFNEWYQGNDIEPEALEARVVLIFKKGDPTIFGNFRPISLLNTLTKTYARVLQKRLADGFEK